MLCVKCQTELPDDAKFCGACGYRFEAPEVAPTSPAPTSAAPAASSPAPAAVDNNPFTLTADDFQAAFEKACAIESKPVPEGVFVHDHASLKTEGDKIGLMQVDVDKALHRVQMEKLSPEERKRMGIVLDHEVEPHKRSPLVAALVGVGVLALGGVAVVAVTYDGTPQRPPVTVAPQQGEIDATALNGALDSVSEQAQGCYRDGLQANKKLAGDITLTVRIGLDGKAESATVKSESLGAADVVECIRGAAAGATYPAAQKAAVEVDVPLSFSAKSK